ncbi:MAG: flavin reductase family protein, partial [Chloroflexi bacterium]|nr:flavin reductase family protein [Chloroflexota bacterium]
MEFTASETAQKDFWKLITGSIVPRPIAWVSTINEEGKPNLAPFSFFNAVCAKPPTLLFTSNLRGTDGNQKDTLNNIKTNNEFVVNIVSKKLLEAMNQSATEYPSSVNEFQIAGVTPGASKIVNPPRVAESPVSIECKLSQIVKIGDGGVGSGSIVIGEILHVSIADEVLLPNHKINITALD